MESFGRIGRIGRLIHEILTDPAYFWWLSLLVIAADAVFTQVIIHFVSCMKPFDLLSRRTELDPTQIQKLTG